MQGPVTVIIIKKACHCEQCQAALDQLLAHNETLDFGATLKE
jgi:hypothetical protein